MDITYFADDSSMGDTSAIDCEKFRDFVGERLSARYPSHTITVTNRLSLLVAETDDLDNEEEIVGYCDTLWDVCKFDWM